MKKYTSAALLALQLTWKCAAAVLLLCAGVQALILRNVLMPGGIPLQVNFSFSSVLDSNIHSPVMGFGALLLLLLALRAGATKGSKSIYTMNRLGLREQQSVLVFGLVFAGYYLIFWAVQTLLCFLWFGWYSQFTLVSSNGLMMAVWHSNWFHFLLPLDAWFGYVRNLVICLCFGLCAACGSSRVRRGKNLLLALTPCVAVLFLYPYGIANITDYFLVPLLLVLAAANYFFLLEGIRNEDAL